MAIPVQKWNNPQGGQVHYTNAAVEASNDAGGLQLSSKSKIYFCHLMLNINLSTFIWQK